MKKYFCIFILCITFTFVTGEQLCVLHSSKVTFVDTKNFNKIELEIPPHSAANMVAGNKHVAIQSNKNVVTIINAQDSQNPFVKNIVIGNDGTPITIAFDNGKFAIVNFSISGPGSLTIIDTNNNYSVSQIGDIGDRPRHIRSGEGCFGIAVERLPNSFDPGIVIVDSNTNKIKKLVKVNNSLPRDLAFGNGDMVVAHQFFTKNPTLIKNVHNNHSVQELHNIVSEWSLGDFNIAFGNNLFALPSEVDQIITLLDSKTQSINPLFLTFEPESIAFSNGFFATANVSSRRIGILKAALSTNEVQPIDFADEVERLIPVQEGFAVITERERRDNLFIIDIKTMTSKAIAQFNNRPVNISLID